MPPCSSASGSVHHSTFKSATSVGFKKHGSASQKSMRGRVWCACKFGHLCLTLKQRSGRGFRPGPIYGLLCHVLWSIWPCSSTGPASISMSRLCRALKKRPCAPNANRQCWQCPWSLADCCMLCLERLTHNPTRWRVMQWRSCAACATSRNGILQPASEAMAQACTCTGNGEECAGLQVHKESEIVARSGERWYQGPPTGSPSISTVMMQPEA